MSKEKEESKILININRIIALLITSCVASKKNFLRMQLLAKISLTIKITKKEKKNNKKTLNIIKTFANNAMFELISHYSKLTFINSTRIESFNASKTNNFLSYVNIYEHEKELWVFLKRKSCILEKNIDKTKTSI